MDIRKKIRIYAELDHAFNFLDMARSFNNSNWDQSITLDHIRRCKKQIKNIKRMIRQYD